MDVQKISFSFPAAAWEEELPIGNGRMGAMSNGGITCERIRLNQDSVWSCGPKNRLNPDARNTLPKVRKALFDGRLEDAEELIYTGMLCDPNELGHYEPLGELLINYEKRIPHYSEMFAPRKYEAADYSRILHLDTAVSECSFMREGTLYRREIFMSYPDQVMAVHLSTSQEKGARISLARPGGFLTMEALCRPKEAPFGKVMRQGTLTMAGQGANGGPTYCCMAYIYADGDLRAIGNYIDIEDAKNIYIFLTASTTYYEMEPARWCRKVLENACGAATKDGFSHERYKWLKERHIADHKELYERYQLSLNDEPVVQYFNFARYLMIAGSRPGSLPLNLQGIWNKDMNPSWGSRYTININLQMNYWPVLKWKLPECEQPLLDLIMLMLPNAKRTAQEMYGCRGAAAHHNTDIYGDCAPNETWMPASIWPMGFAWLCCHIIEHYRVLPSEDFALTYLEPVREASVFFLDYLITSPKGKLVTSPSTSPENTYILPNGQKSAICYGPTMDTLIIKELWTGYLMMAEAAGHPEQEIEEEIREKLAMLPSDFIGSRGQVKEWQEEYEEWEKGHRHISHLFGLYPGNSFAVKEDPAIRSACIQTLHERLKYGGGQTGWSSAWLINMYARLGMGEEAYAVLQKLLQEQTAPNLFDLHPPLSSNMDCVFQIDGNFGAAAGIMEMPENDALPACWREKITSE